MRDTLYHLGFFKWSLLALALGIGLGWFMGGPSLAFVITILCVLEISLSFENSVINAGVLSRMSKFWQDMFLTVGILIAVFGMRLLLPIVIVMATAGLGFMEVVNLALQHPEEYAKELHEAHPSIASFGGIFLFMIFLDFLFDEGKKVHWLRRLEEPLVTAGRLKTFSSLIALIALLVVTGTLGGEHKFEVLAAGVAGMVTYLGVRGLSRLFEALGGIEEGDRDKLKEKAHGVAPLVGKAAFSMFLYLEVLDASFSFDGVVGAFAITGNVVAIAVGLGVGAFFIRSLTVWLVRHDTLRQVTYLEHGAHYAVGSLAVLLGLSLAYDIPNVVTGLIGAGFILTAVVSSFAERGIKPRAS